MITVHTLPDKHNKANEQIILRKNLEGNCYLALKILKAFMNQLKANGQDSKHRLTQSQEGNRCFYFLDWHFVSRNKKLH